MCMLSGLMDPRQLEWNKGFWPNAVHKHLQLIASTPEGALGMQGRGSDDFGSDVIEEDGMKVIIWLAFT